MASERMLQFVGREQSYPDKRSAEERARDPSFRGPSFETISAHGPNAALRIEQRNGMVVTEVELPEEK